MNILTITDFELDTSAGNDIAYFSHEYIGWDGNTYVVCLESCLNGFDVANYVLANLDLTDPKVCTDSKDRKDNLRDYLNTLSQALFIASEMRHKYAYKMKKTEQVI